jgi:hypothetical protein
MKNKKVSRFQAMTKETNPGTQKAFAVVTKEFGDALNHLLQTLDSSFVRKIELAVREGRKAGTVSPKLMNGFFVEEKLSSV